MRGGHCAAREARSAGNNGVCYTAAIKITNHLTITALIMTIRKDRKACTCLHLPGSTNRIAVLLTGMTALVISACGGGSSSSDSASPLSADPTTAPSAAPTQTPITTPAPSSEATASPSPTATSVPGDEPDPTVINGPKLELEFDTASDISGWVADSFGDNVAFTHEHDAGKAAFKITPNWRVGEAGQGYSFIVATDQTVTADGARFEIDLEIPEEYVAENKLEINFVSQMNQQPYTYNFISYQAGDFEAGINRIVFESVTPEIFRQNANLEGDLLQSQRFGLSLASRGSAYSLPLFIHRVSLAYPEAVVVAPENEFEPTGETGILERPIIVDQFGYAPAMQKIAVIKNPQEGNDSRASYTPGSRMQVVKAGTNESVFEGNVVRWKDGLTDDSSGDKAWHFDFSGLEVPGEYEVLDPSTDKRSYRFEINADVYKSALKDAVRTFFYQRAGFAKTEQYAGDWADGASHLGANQDTEAKLYTSPTDENTGRDLSGGWYDAGDYNKYTQWTARYILTLLHTYQENQPLWDSAWGDSLNIPESGNNVADLLDEARWGMDHLLRLQEPNGSVLSIVALADATPASSATGASLYGPANTSSTFMSAAAYAYGAKIWSADANYAARLSKAAEDAWAWGVANPEVVWQNNLQYRGPSGEINSVGIGAGRQECGIGDNTSLYEDNFVLRARCKEFIQTRKLFAAIYLADLNADNEYVKYVEDNYQDFALFARNYLSEYEAEETMAITYYASSAAASEATATAINNALRNGLNAQNYANSYTSIQDPYLSYLQTYTWGSNGIKASKGNTYLEATLSGRNISTALSKAELKDAAAGYIHYIHGVNPWGINMLSNMDERGAENSVDEFFHAAYKVDRDTKYNAKQGIGPAPGFLVGGANPSHSWDACCWTKTCGGLPNGGADICGENPPMPPMFQPDQKSFAEDGRGWPLNTWSITENSNSYQVQYIRLLSKYVSP